MDFESYLMSTGYVDEEIAKVTSGIQSVANTGSQLIFTMNDSSTITVTITGLSDNNYTITEKNKLGSIDSTLLNRFTYVNNQLLFDGLPIANSTLDLSAYLKTIDADNKYEAKDSSIVKDSNYIHTDVNYTTSDQTKLLNIDISKIDSAYSHISDVNNPHQIKISNLKDTNVISPTDKQVLVYDLATSKWINQTVSGMDEKVKMTSSSVSSKYLSEWIDGISIQNIGDKLVCKSLDGMNITLVELNRLSGLDKNIMDYLNAISNPMTVKGIVNTYADLSSITSPTNGNVVIVKTDENNSNKQWTYIYVDNVWNPLTESNVSVRDFSIDKLDLTLEVKNKLPQTNMDLTGIAKTTDLADYLKSTDASNTYATITQVGSKANSSDVYTQTQTDSLLSNKSNVGHGHNISDVANLQTNLDSKLTVNDIVAGNNITLTKVGNTTTINSTASGRTGILSYTDFVI